MSRQGRWEYFRAIQERYRKGDRRTQGMILNEFCLNRGYHRKYAIGLLGIDSDNGAEFLNWHLGRWCARHEVQFTRGRPCQKEDQARGEQKNWTPVRKLLGWNRYDSPPADGAINDLYRNELRLWLNLYLPSVKLLRKVRVGSKLRRVYDAAGTPLQRVIASELGDPAPIASWQARMKTLDPFALAPAIDQKLHRIEALAHRRWSPQETPGGSLTFSMTRLLDPGLHS